MLVLCFFLARWSRGLCPICTSGWAQGGSWWRMSVLCLQEPSALFCLSEHQGREVLHVVTGVVCILGGGFLESSAWSVLCSSSEKNNLTKPSVSGSCQYTQSCNDVGRVGGLIKGRVIHLCYHTQKSLSAVSMLAAIMMHCLIKSELILWYCWLLFCVIWEGNI